MITFIKNIEFVVLLNMLKKKPEQIIKHIEVKK